MQTLGHKDLTLPGGREKVVHEPIALFSTVAVLPCDGLVERNTGGVWSNPDPTEVDGNVATSFSWTKILLL